MAALRPHALAPSAARRPLEAHLPCLVIPGAVPGRLGRLAAPPSQQTGSSSSSSSGATAPRGRHTAAAAPAAAAAGTSATSAAAACFPAMQAALEPVLPYAMAAAAACCALLILLMAVAPRAKVTQQSARSNAPLIVLAGLYGLVLLASWSSDTLALMMPGSLQEGLKGGFNPQFFPTLASVQALFGRPFTAASFLLHVAAINLIAARSAYLDGLAARVPTVHSILLSAVVGPLGLLSHQLTKWVYSLLSAALGRDLRPAAKPVQERSGGGTLTIMPYD